MKKSVKYKSIELVKIYHSHSDKLVK